MKQAKVITSTRTQGRERFLCFTRFLGKHPKAGAEPDLNDFTHRRVIPLLLQHLHLDFVQTDPRRLLPLQPRIHDPVQILNLAPLPPPLPFHIRLPGIPALLAEQPLLPRRLVRLGLFAELVQRFLPRASDVEAGEREFDVGGGEAAAYPGPVEGGFEAVELSEELLDVGRLKVGEDRRVAVVEGRVAVGDEEGADEFVGRFRCGEDGGVGRCCDGGCFLLLGGRGGFGGGFAEERVEGHGWLIGGWWCFSLFGVDEVTAGLWRKCLGKEIEMAIVGFERLVLVDAEMCMTSSNAGYLTDVASRKGFAIMGDKGTSTQKESCCSFSGRQSRRRIHVRSYLVGLFVSLSPIRWH